jgi:predicted enzyme related to lactoylglutathione lyase
MSGGGRLFFKTVFQECSPDIPRFLCYTLYNQSHNSYYLGALIFMAQVKKLAMVIFMQPDVEAAVALYSKLGLTLLFHIKERWAEFDLNGVKIGLCPSSKPMTEFRTGVVFEVADVRKIYDELKNTGIFLGEPMEAVHGVMASLKDPGGNIIDLYQQTPDKVKDFVANTVAQEHQNESGGCCKAKAQTCC